MPRARSGGSRSARNRFRRRSADAARGLTSVAGAASTRAPGPFPLRRKPIREKRAEEYVVALLSLCRCAGYPLLFLRRRPKPVRGMVLSLGRPCSSKGRRRHCPARTRQLIERQVGSRGCARISDRFLTGLSSVFRTRRRCAGNSPGWGHEKAATTGYPTGDRVLDGLPTAQAPRAVNGGEDGADGKL